jgi:Lrp/AsnC family leucine-responsive transcriptional regulator
LVIEGLTAVLYLSLNVITTMTFKSESAIDELDWKIVVALQEDARLSMSALGRQIGLSAPATTERVRRLEERKVIRAYRAEIGLECVGLAVQAIICLHSTW